MRRMWVAWTPDGVEPTAVIHIVYYAMVGFVALYLVTVGVGLYLLIRQEATPSPEDLESEYMEEPP